MPGTRPRALALGMYDPRFKLREIDPAPDIIFYKKYSGYMSVSVALIVTLLLPLLPAGAPAGAPQSPVELPARLKHACKLTKQYDWATGQTRFDLGMAQVAGAEPD